MKQIAQAVFLLITATGLTIATAAEKPQAATPSPNGKPAVNLDDLFTKTVAKGKGFTITQSQLDDALVRAKGALAARGQTVPPARQSEFELQVLENLIRTKLILAEATDTDRKAGKERADKQYETILTNGSAAGVLDNQLKAAGLTRDEFRKQMDDQFTAEATLERVLNVKVTDADAKKYYEDNPGRFEVPEMVKITYLLISTRNPQTGEELSDSQKAEKKKLAEDVLKRARGGEDFNKLADEYTDDRMAKQNNNQLTFPRGNPRIPPEFEGAAFALKTNEISDVVSTSYGYYLIKLNEKLPAHKVEFDKAAENIKLLLTQQDIMKKLPDYIKKLKADAGVEILDPDLKAMEANAEATAPSAAAPGQNSTPEKMATPDTPDKQ